MVAKRHPNRSQKSEVMVNKGKATEKISRLFRCAARLAITFTALIQVARRD